MFKLLKSDSGVTLVELVIALLITAILSIAMFRIYVNQHQAWIIQDSVIEMQQNARAAVSELTRQLRMAGYAVPNSLDPLIARDGNPDSITVFYRTNTCEATLELDMLGLTNDLCCNGHDVSCFETGQKAYIYDPVLESGEFFIVSHVDSSLDQIQHTGSTLTKVYLKGSVVMAINEVTFFIDATDILHPRLMLAMGDGVPHIYAEDIVNLDISYIMKNGMTVSEPYAANEVRQIGLSVTARTPNPNVEISGDPYCYETYRSQVYLRNLGG